MDDARMTRLAICHLHFEELDKDILNEWIKIRPERYQTLNYFN